MAFCDQRVAELRASLTAIPAPDVSDAERAALLAAINQWDERRRQHLDAMCVALREASGPVAAEAWRRSADGLRDGLRQFSDTARNLNSASVDAVRFVVTNATADERFVAAVSEAVTAAEARDYMVTYLETVRAEARRLEVAWAALLSQNSSFVEQQKAAIDQVDTMVRDAMAKARDLDARIASSIGDSLSKLKTLLQSAPEGATNTANVPLSTEATIVGTMVDAFRALSAGVEDQRSRFERYMREEMGSVLFLFQDFREDTQRFIEEFGYNEVVEREETANRALAAIASNGGTTSSNRTDAEAFATAATILVKGHVNNARNTWDNFVEKHKEKFFGPIRPDFSRALLDREMFEAKYARLQAADLRELAERWRNNARTVWGVDAAGLPPHIAESYRNALQDELRKLDELLRDPLLERFGTSMRAVMDNAWSLMR